MKKLLCSLTLFLIFQSISSQTIVDMAGQREMFHYDNGEYYIKDVNDYLLPFLGTWKYNNGNSEFRITLTKITKYHDIDEDYKIDYFIDGVLLSYEKYENNELVFSSPNTNTFPQGIIKEFGKLRMGFTDYQRNDVSFRLSLDLIPINTMGSETQYSLKFWLNNGLEAFNTYFEQHPNEPYYSVPNNVVMTKI